MGTSNDFRELSLRYRALASSGSEMELRAAMRRIAAEFAERAVAEEIEHISTPVLMIREISRRPFLGLALVSVRRFWASMLAHLRYLRRPPDSAAPAC